MKYCPKCGFHAENMKFCPKCGYELNANVAKNGEEIAAIEEDIPEGEVIRSAEESQDSDDEVRTLRTELIGEKADHYIPIFEDLDKNGGQSWNWCGCLVSPMWFAYRKLYGWAAIAIAAPAIVGFLLGIILYSINPNGTFDIASKLLSVAFAIFFGVISNSAYKKRIDKLVAEVPSDPDMRAEFIGKKGGVSAGGVVLAIVVALALNGIATYASM